MPQLLYMAFTSGAVNQIYGSLVIGLIIILAWQYYRVGHAYVNGLRSSGFRLLFVFGMLYFSFGDRSIRGVEYYFACPLIAYLGGWVTVEAGKRKPEETIRNTIYFMLFGYSIHAILNYSVNIGRVRWKLIDFYTKSYRAATGSGYINTLIFSLCVYLIVLEKNIAIKIAGVAETIISLLYAFLLGTRTQFLIFGIVSVSFLFIYLLKGYRYTAAIRLIIVVTSAVAVYFYLYSHNSFGLRTFIDSSNLAERYKYRSDLSRSDSYRYSSLGRGLLSMLEHPFGGLESTAYFHNMWLDIGRVSGIMPFIVMVVYSVVTDVHAIKILLKKALDIRFRYLIFCVYLGIQINFFTEPVLEGFFGFFLNFMIINGMVEAYFYRL